MRPRAAGVSPGEEIRSFLWGRGVAEVRARNWDAKRVCHCLGCVRYQWKVCMKCLADNQRVYLLNEIPIVSPWHQWDLTESKLKSSASMVFLLRKQFPTTDAFFLSYVIYIILGILYMQCLTIFNWAYFFLLLHHPHHHNQSLHMKSLFSKIILFYYVIMFLLCFIVIYFT